MKSNEVRPALINASWYNTLKSFDFAWKDYPIPPPRIRALRDQDPDEVVQRIRTQLKQKHSSFDTIWRKHDPQSAFGTDKARQAGFDLIDSFPPPRKELKNTRSRHSDPVPANKSRTKFKVEQQKKSHEIERDRPPTAKDGGDRGGRGRR
ncbi:hypothetical protein RvY_12452-1 [Ramazzottius varieornatus]|uniref:Uncharacterized protein n=1 Tax=Ramazzottius varieornatus TaxID=947166 RepID=A0A1D1VPZ8_RAMVA|nr:hypothetical protein RvY_12452-1 [Ramazzottius varieornatus]